MDKLNGADMSPVEAKSVEAAASGIARRRLLRAGMAAAPLMLTLSGRSAMATNTDIPKGLSPMAWASVAPNGTFVAVSHTVGTHKLGLSPGFWTPNTNGKTFPGTKWPVAPFDEVETLVGHGITAVRQIKSWDSYPYGSFKDVAASDPGFANGVKFNSVFTGGDSRSFSRILLDESASQNVVWHFTAAYLNVMAFSGTYAIALLELQYLYANRQLVSGGMTLSDSQIKAFLDQTWG